MPNENKKKEARVEAPQKAADSDDDILCSPDEATPVVERKRLMKASRPSDEF